MRDPRDLARLYEALLKDDCEESDWRGDGRERSGRRPTTYFTRQAARAAGHNAGGGGSAVLPDGRRTFHSRATHTLIPTRAGRSS